MSFALYVCIPNVYNATWRAEHGTKLPETGAVNDCRLPCWCCELNSGRLQEQPVL